MNVADSCWFMKNSHFYRPSGSIAVTRGKVAHSYLFESSWKNKYTDRCVLKIQVFKKTGLAQNILLHKLRHF